METIFIYIVKVNIALALFYLLYVFLLKRDTFIGLRRYYFLSMIVFSLSYPFFSIDTLGNLFTIDYSAYQSETVVSVGEAQMTMEGDIPASTTPSFFSWKELLLFILLTGSTVLTARFLWQFTTILRIRAKSEKRIVFDVPIYHLTKEITPFSFFGWIFMNTEAHSADELKQITLHEQIHVHQRHSIDVVMAEFLCILFWWNPFVWLMKREMAINLEYLADNGVLREGVNSRDYQYHLLRLTYHETAVQIVNNFNVSTQYKLV